jgi:formate hydrogenlyase subunit 3/multisubunit Na+/H+ antiporter MnhD subunit
MNWLLIALSILCLAGALALAVSVRWGRAVSWIGAAGPVLAALLGLPDPLRTLWHGEAARLTLAWQMPLGTCALKLDGLSAFFIIPILLLSALCAIYGVGYLRGRSGISLGICWCAYNILAASMVVVCLADNGLLFLVAWEIMALSSFFLVAFENEEGRVRKAAWTYLVATHLGTACLLPLFLLCGASAGSLDFAAFPGTLTPTLAGVCFILALIGFGTKAGIMPFHVWLPEAHPAAPSHVSALLSGIMIKTGIYGLVRVLTFLGPPPLWWGFTLVVAGAVSGVLGVLFALAQHDLKRLLAYHSVENIGIIVLGLGIGLVGVSTGHPLMAAAGLAGGLLHVLNHALFKGLLFLGAGSVLHATGTREIDHLGGLIKKMPVTAAAFLVGAVAICGLPPLNGFVSEFLVYIGLMQGAVAPDAGQGIAAAGAMAALALIGGLAAACFTKAFGIVFLGEPRSAQTAATHEANALMLTPMVLLAVGCVAVGLTGPWVLRGVWPAVALVAGPLAQPELHRLTGLLWWTSGGALAIILLTLVVLLVRWRLLARRVIGQAVTWDCGYAAPHPRMQYTASSFAQPITDLFRAVLWTRKRGRAPQALFPVDAELETETPDVGREGLYQPVFAAIKRTLGRFQVLQQGRVQIYVMYVVATLVVLLVWQLR